MTPLSGDSTWPPSESANSLEGDGQIEDQLVDHLFEDDFDWVDIVRSYPIPSLIVSALGGYLLGRRHGASLFEAFGDQVADRVTRAMER